MITQIRQVLLAMLAVLEMRLVAAVAEEAAKKILAMSANAATPANADYLTLTQ